MIFQRTIAPYIIKQAEKLPVVAVIGPRQSGKTTLCKSLFAEYAYVSLEDPDIRAYATVDGRGFLKQFATTDGVILDEIQHVPALLSYIQTLVDADDRPGRFIITGSQHFLVHESISQTLAGRVAICTLLPLSLQEFVANKMDLSDLGKILWYGSYPRIHGKSLDPASWYKDYLVTYVEKDVRSIKNIVDLDQFVYFLKLCAGRVGQIVNLQSLASDAGIDVRTVKSWFSVLQNSFIIYFLHPYYKNFSKRIVKSPKLYFYDTGFLCSLLGVENSDQIATHYAKGHIFESAMITECLKYFVHHNRTPHLYFWQDHHGDEIDCVVEKGNALILLEMKSGMTVSEHFFKQLLSFEKIAKDEVIQKFVIYTGQMAQKRSYATVLPWNELGDLYDVLGK